MAWRCLAQDSYPSALDEAFCCLPTGSRTRLIDRLVVEVPPSPEGSRFDLEEVFVLDCFLVFWGASSSDNGEDRYIIIRKSLDFTRILSILW